MIKNSLIALSIIALSSPAFAHEGEHHDAPLNAKAEIKNAQGKKIGSALFTETENGVKISVKVSKLSEGEHGIHIHEFGKCEGPDFKSAGGHFNPSAKQHGLENPEGHHAGDLKNLVADKKGKAEGEFIAHGVTLKKGEANSLLKPDGTSLMIHEKVDDQKTDPSGNSGTRIACGVIRG